MFCVVIYVVILSLMCVIIFSAVRSFVDMVVSMFAFQLSYNQKLWVEVPPAVSCTYQIVSSKLVSYCSKKEGNQYQNV